MRPEDMDLSKGYLFNFKDHGVYSPDGIVPGYTAEDVDTHNALLSQAEIEGLDNAKVGQWGTLYLNHEKGNRKALVRTWIGTFVSYGQVNGKSITFDRPNGHKFRGIMRKDMDCFNFKRIF